MAVNFDMGSSGWSWGAVWPRFGLLAGAEVLRRVAGRVLGR